MEIKRQLALTEEKNVDEFDRKSELRKLSFMRGSSLLDSANLSKNFELTKAQLESLVGIKLQSPPKRKLLSEYESSIDLSRAKLIPKNRLIDRAKESDSYSINSYIDDAEKSFKQLNNKFEDKGDESDSIYGNVIGKVRDSELFDESNENTSPENEQDPSPRMKENLGIEKGSSNENELELELPDSRSYIEEDSPKSHSQAYPSIVIKEASEEIGHEEELKSPTMEDIPPKSPVNNRGSLLKPIRLDPNSNETIPKIKIKDTPEADISTPQFDHSEAMKFKYEEHKISHIPDNHQTLKIPLETKKIALEYLTPKVAASDPLMNPADIRKKLKSMTHHDTTPSMRKDKVSLSKDNTPKNNKKSSKRKLSAKKLYEKLEKRSPFDMTRFASSKRSEISEETDSGTGTQSCPKKVRKHFAEDFPVQEEIPTNESPDLTDPTYWEIHSERGYYSDSHIKYTNMTSTRQQRIGINDFEFLKMISKGAFGRVWLVRRKATGDIYAMKIINLAEKFMKNSKDIDSLKKENKVWGLVQEDFVVRAVFTFTYETFICFVMEYMIGDRKSVV